MSNSESEKKLAAVHSVQFIESGMRVGLGTGSTVAHLIPALSERVKSGLKISTVVTSVRTGELALAHGIEVLPFDGSPVDLTIDGADEIDPQFRLIKGGGGALLHEKLVAVSSAQNIVIADSAKLVSNLGNRALPVEVIKFGWQRAVAQLESLGCRSVLRMVPDGSSPFLSDEGNFILDCDFGIISDPAHLAGSIKSIVGVVEHGLFLETATKVVLGGPEGVRELTKNL